MDSSAGDPGSDVRPTWSWTTAHTRNTTHDTYDDMIIRVQSWDLKNQMKKWMAIYIMGMGGRYL